MEWHTEWRNGKNGVRNGGMAEWRNGIQNGIRNGGMAYRIAYGMAGMARMQKRIVQKGNRAKGYITWIEEGNVMKQSSTKGYEDELQAHFNSII